MIQLSEVFNMIGTNGCSDVATSLQMQGTESDISIPIYEIFYLHILPAEHSNFMASSIPEANAIRQLAISCGGVSCTINLLDMDILTLAGVLCIFTPDTGMNVFFKDNIPDLANMTEEIVGTLAEMVGIPVQAGNVTMDIAVKAIDMLFNKLVDSMEQNLGNCGINLKRWEELPEYYEYLKNSGEMQEMHSYRDIVGAAIM